MLAWGVPTYVHVVELWLESQNNLVSLTHWAAMCLSAPYWFLFTCLTPDDFTRQWGSSAAYSQTGCSLESNIAILSHNISILMGRLLWAICNRREQIASWNSQKICNQSLWLDYKKGGSTNPVAQTIWLASLFLIVQSEALFTNILWISTCNLFTSVAICSEQSAYQNCNIVGQYCNVACKRTSALTVMG
jgi:hypothetical protein